MPNEADCEKDMIISLNKYYKKHIRRAHLTNQDKDKIYWSSHSSALLGYLLYQHEAGNIFPTSKSNRLINRFVLGVQIPTPISMEKDQLDEVIKDFSKELKDTFKGIQPDDKR